MEDVEAVSSPITDMPAHRARGSCCQAEGCIECCIYIDQDLHLVLTGHHVMRSRSRIMQGLQAELGVTHRHAGVQVRASVCRTDGRGDCGIHGLYDRHHAEAHALLAVSEKAGYSDI